MARSVSIPSLISNTSLSVTLGCWEQLPPVDPQLTPLTYIECKQAISEIPMGEKALAPLSFGRDPGAGFTVPYTWDYGNCAIEIDVLREDDEERSTFAAIFKRAFDIAVECVIKPPHLGGKGLVGKNEQLKTPRLGDGRGFTGWIAEEHVDVATYLRYSSHLRSKSTQPGEFGKMERKRKTYLIPIKDINNLSATWFVSLKR
ncbi:MAG: hypothetical protein ALECFALPRED_009420 [Alectoria fallacina]|uniref:Uncharacterized protein n=1 Tax=Alectoria fallacina TaxID=1903189 RepID=A0A8H3PIW8_9LECA|nr:MAG: hypothetical protein ALECFALPRED_009420 [Alectoria fallacina]